uniref:non-specific serine/threonine protein kinase n=1 Tax=Brassica campestris TaxID=3711 RepID=A0A3P5ZPK2_BRACM|nr:unnamed protein product [Brassica rapa]
MRILRKTLVSFPLFIFLFLYESSTAQDTIRRGEFLRDGSTHKPLVSPQKTFELGFFTPGSSTGRYLGIWYGNIEDKAVVWVANRENPISDQSGVLTISNDGNLVLLNGQNITVWSSNITSTNNDNNRVGAIRDTGNFELIEVTSERVIWESFNHPTDTFLPNMRVRVNPQTGDNLAFVSWRSENDPSPGNFSLGVDPSGAPEIVLWGRNNTRRWRSGQWNSAIFTGIPNMALLTNYLYGFKLSSPPDETGSVYFTYVPSDPTVLLRFKVLHNGTEEELRWNETSKRWTKFQAAPESECDKYNRCGSFGICNMKGDNGICSCVDGYEPVSVGNWSRGCRRRTPLKCERRNVSNVGEDEFLTLKSVKLPDFETPEHSLADPEDCKDRCLNNCSCTAFTFVNGIGCMIWNQDLVDLQQFEAGGSSLHVRLADSEIGESKKTKIVVIVAVLAGVVFGVPEMQPFDYIEFNFTTSNQEVTYSFHITKDNMYSRLSLSSTGKTALSCNGGDGFVRLKKMKLPDTAATSVDRGIGIKECEEKCKSDCNCTAFANTDIRGGGSGCVVWTGDILDTRNYAKGVNYGRILTIFTTSEDTTNRNAKIIGSCIGVSVLLLLCFIFYRFWKRKQKRSIAIETSFVVIPSRRHISRENKTDDLELPLMDFEAVAIATDNFTNANKLGQGGFGIVYKGRLLDGQEIAVKRLSKMSVQGTDEFKNEVKLIARLQHINLVRLLGCCVDEGEKMLIYEYLENLSLDSHLFDKTRSCKLNWQKRFDITNGIARGLLYLHQDSRFRIIHRDLKASNVLLDKDMTPKISDFGMARIFGRDETEANTRKVVGTYGYMSPEYAMDGIFSTKSDVFSFGVLLLEIISGKRNKGFYNSDHDLNLLGCVWRNWKKGKGLDIVDPIILDSSPSTYRPLEILRCIKIGLLCVQERANDRPTMSSVVMMLGSETAAIPQPEQPGYCVGRSPLDTDSSSSNQRNDESWSVNQMTVSVIDPR